MRIPKPVKPKLGLQRAFEEHSETIYRGMKARVAERRNEQNVIIRVGRPIPFTLQEFRDWVLAQFGGNWDSTAKCAYCPARLNVATFVVDHDLPLAPPWCGGLGLDNCRISCQHCNTLKGKLSGETFVKFVDWVVENIPSHEATDIFARMKNGAAYLKSKWRKAEQEAKVEITAPRGQLWLR